MDLTGLYVLAAGILFALLVAGGSFLFAVVNMGSSVSGKRSFEGMFAGHLSAMGGMAVGGFGGVAIGLIGIVMLIVEAVAVYG